MITGVQNLIYFVEVDLIALLQEPAAKTKKKVTITASVVHVPPDHLTTVNSGKSLSATLESLFTEVKLHFIPTYSRGFLLFSRHFADVTKALVEQE